MSRSHTFGYLLRKEFKQIVRNPITLLLIFLFPAVMIGLAPFVINFNLKELHLTVVNRDPTGTYSRKLVQKIEAAEDISIVSSPADMEEAYDEIDQHRTDAILVIPEDFSREMELSQHATVQLMANAINSTQAILAMNRMAGLIADTSGEILSERSGLPPGTTPIEIRTLDRYNPSLNYKYYMLPAILVMVLTMLAGIYPAVGLANEKEEGTIRQINLSPIRPGTFVLAKVLPYWIIGIGVTLFGVLLIYFIYGLAPLGSFYMILFACLLFSVVISFYGLLVANMSKTVQQAMFIEFFSVMVFFIISGLFTPIETMPGWARAIAYINPLTYLNSIMRMIYLKGSGFAELWPYFLVLTALGVVNGVISVLSYRKRE